MTKNTENTKKETVRSCVRALPRAALLIMIFVVAGSFSFLLGIRTAGDVDPITTIGAQTPQTTRVNVILQVQPLAGGPLQPVVITPFMNASQTSLVTLQEIHTGGVVPANSADQCRTTNTAGRCNINNVPVGGTPEAQYDVIVNRDFLEFLTGVPFETVGSFVRFDRSACGSQNAFTGNTWCIGKQSGSYNAEYFVTITLRERNGCAGTTPPAAFCDSDPKSIVRFACVPATSASTKPWEPRPESCGPVSCPDGNVLTGTCGEVSEGLAACSTAFSCTANQLCEVRNFNSLITYQAGQDAILIGGKRFGNAGGSVSFPVGTNKREVVQVFTGPDWTDAQIRVRVPITAVSGTLEVHPNTHGSITVNGVSTPVACSTPPAAIRAFADQFSMLAVTASSPNGIQLVSPGFTTTLAITARHNDNVSRFRDVAVELLQGAYPDPQQIPLQRSVITRVHCPATVVGSPNARETTFTCAVPVPAGASAFRGPFTFVVTLTDDEGGDASATLLDGGESALLGDFDLDRKLTIKDAATALRISRGTFPAQPEQLTRDTNRDERITIDDALFDLHSLTR